MDFLRHMADLPIKVFRDPIGPEDQDFRPFVWTDAFLKTINRQPNQVILHLWPMANRVILGMLDRQLPDFQAGLAVLRQQGYQPVVRHIGGLAVVADSGVLNFSLILPDRLAGEKLSIAQAYLLMVDLVRHLFEADGKAIDHCQIDRSYCPGTYDLSIAGKKFAGLAQRRIKAGIVVSIYLSVSGNQDQRGQMIRDFYEAGQASSNSTITYPDIDPACMASLSHLLGRDLTVNQVMDELLICLQHLGADLSPLELDQAILADYQTSVSQHENRHQEVAR